MPKPLIFFLLLSVSSIFSKTANGSKALASNCPSNACGGVIISYPFWLTSNTTSNQYCGYPGFNLSCSNKENTIINIGGDSYYVKNISYTDNTFTPIDVAVTAKPTCPRPLHNVTIQTLPLSYNRQDLNLSFYFNCSPGIVWYSEAPPNATKCLSSKDKDSYVFVNGTEPVVLSDNWHHFCEEKVVVAVMESEIDANNSLNEGFGGVMKAGSCSIGGRHHRAARVRRQSGGAGLIIPMIIFCAFAPMDPHALMIRAKVRRFTKMLSGSPTNPSPKPEISTTSAELTYATEPLSSTTSTKM